MRTILPGAIGAMAVLHVRGLNSRVRNSRTSPHAVTGPMPERRWSWNLLRLLALPAVVAAALFAVAPVTAHETRQHDRDAIVAVMKKTWDQPSSPLRVEPVVTRGDHAVAGWVQGDMGGRALLARTHHGWRVVLCSGDALKDEAFLVQAGIGKADAQAMAREIAATERKLPAATLAKFASFEGVVRMDGDGNHPPGHAPGKDGQRSH